MWESQRSEQIKTHLQSEQGSDWKLSNLVFLEFVSKTQERLLARLCSFSEEFISRVMKDSS